MKVIEAFVIFLKKRNWHPVPFIQGLWCLLRVRYKNEMHLLSNECSNEIHSTAELYGAGDQQPEREAASTVHTLFLQSIPVERSQGCTKGGVGWR